MQGSPGFEIRAATHEDRDAIAQVHVRSWQVGYRGLMPDEYLDQLRPEDRSSRYTFGADPFTGPHWLVATHEDTVLGFAQCGRSRDEDTPGHGEVFALYVDPDVWGRGVGRALLASAESTLHRMHCRAANLWVLVGNARTIRFYEHSGWTPDGRARTEEVWGLHVESARFQRTLTLGPATGRPEPSPPNTSSTPGQASA